MVLTSLTLFMMMGTLMLITAIRARATARAFANAATSSDVSLIQSRAALDEALMLALRGTRAAALLPLTESILEDKYGAATISGSGATLSGNVARDPILTLTLTSATNATLNGRIITLKDRSAADWTSFRIVGVDANEVYLANVPFRPALGIQASGTYDYRINGREFTPISGTTTPEPYDAYDDANAWLAQPVLAGGQVGGVFNRLSFLTGTSGTAAQVDNDNDGILDGIWLDGTTNFLPPTVSPGGNRVRYRVSYLIVDLDGRINVNAAGMAARPAGTSDYGPAVPLGMGYGPADVDASLVVSGVLPAADGFSAFTRPSGAADPRAWANVILGGTANQAFAPTASQRRVPPAIGAFTGRYGANGKPGIAGDDADKTQQTGTSDPWLAGGTNSLYRSLCGGTNAVADLRGHVKLSVEPPSGTSAQIAPTVVFHAPDILTASADAIDDPYEVRFSALAPPRGATLTGTTAGMDDNLFTPADLERILRAGDVDALALPNRLPAALEDRAQAMRMSLTTDSWDTPALTGTAAALVERFMASLSYPWDARNALSPDTAAGLRFNVNRRLSGTSAIENRNYLRGLYTLALAMGGTNVTPAGAAEAAQWAVNVLDFRDEDSTMTGFEYDSLPADGWDVDGDVSTNTGQEKNRAVVWGVERPELVIAETAGWHNTLSGTVSGTGQLFVTLLRPTWTTTRTGSSGSQPSEILSTDLGANNALDLTKLQAKQGDKYPVWQVRFKPDKVLQFIDPQQLTASNKTQSQYLLRNQQVVTQAAYANGSNSAVPPLADGGHLYVRASGTWSYFSTGSPSVIIDKGSFFDPLCRSLTLERLADPTRPNAIDNPYVVVDTGTVAMIPVTPPAAATFTTRRRPGPLEPPAGLSSLAVFWNSAAFVESSPMLVSYASRVGRPDKYVPRFHWPNRPFVSHAELALVPSDSAEDLLKNYDFPLRSIATGSASAIMDATTVPSRFAGTYVYVSGTHQRVKDMGLDQLGLHQFSTWREPGRINVNTIVSGTSPAVDTDGLVWAALMSGTQLTIASGTATAAIRANPFASGTTNLPTPARSVAQLLSLSLEPSQPIAREIFSSGTSLNPRDKHPFLAHATAIRLANTATIRSNVFAVWITLEVTEDTATVPHVEYKRLFAIIDRSIPVGFSPGEDLNVRDTIRLIRYLD
jgi:hypothetical protein